MVESIFVLYHTRRKPFGPSASEGEAPCLHLLRVEDSHGRKDTPNRPRTSADMAESMVGAWVLSGDFEPGRSAEQPYIPSFTRQGASCRTRIRVPEMACLEPYGRGVTLQLALRANELL